MDIGNAIIFMKPVYRFAATRQGSPLTEIGKKLKGIGKAL
jgi:hypothetical protein